MRHWGLTCGASLAGLSLQCPGLESFAAVLCLLILLSVLPYGHLELVLQHGTFRELDLCLICSGVSPTLAAAVMLWRGEEETLAACGIHRSSSHQLEGTTIQPNPA